MEDHRPYDHPHEPRRAGNLGDPSVHDEHLSEPAEGARFPGKDDARDLRKHPVEPAEGRRDIGG